MQLFSKRIIVLFWLLFSCKLIVGQTTVTIFPTEDVVLLQCDANTSSSIKAWSSTNYGNVVYLSTQEWTYNGYQYQMKGLIKWDMSSIPSNAEITSAYLSLYAYDPTGSSGATKHANAVTMNNSSYKPNTSYLKRILEDWNESTVTWKTNPSSTTSHQVTLVSSTSLNQNYLNINITNLVSDMLSYGNYGLSFNLANPGTGSKYSSMSFCSSDHPNVSLRPKVVITYTIPIAVAPTSVSATSTTICSGSSTTLTYSGGSGTTFKWYTSSCGGTLVGTGNNVSVSPTTTTTYYGRWENSSGSSSCKTVTITCKTVPSQPSTISGDVSPCQGSEGLTYSVTNVPDVTYDWIVPNGWSITSGQGSSSVTVTAGNSGGILSVTPSNDCGDGTPRTLDITVDLYTEIQVSDDNLSVTPNGGDGTYSYLWSTGETSQVISTNGKGIYSVKVTDGLGAQITATHDFANADNHFDYNFLKTETILVEGITSESQIPDLDISKKSVSFQYFDGLGRPSQTVAVKASPTMKDIVQIFEYDELERKAKEYLAYTVTSGNGAFRDVAKSELENFYFTNTDGANDIYPFSEKIYDRSPLSRPIEQSTPGETWQIEKDIDGNSTGNGHTIRFEYTTNDETIDNWIVNSSGDCVKNDVYQSNTLYKTSSRNENNVLTYEYKDKRGKLILSVSDDETHKYKLKTFYVYDQFDRLAYILPPKAVEAISGTNIPQDVYDELIYAYKYDPKGRVISKKIPGAEEIYMVYDNLNRLVLSQDGVKRENNEWSFIKYDVLGRPVFSGIVTITTQTHQSLQNYFGNYAGKMYETQNTNLDFGYTLNNSFPILSITEANINVATYFDNYKMFTDPIYNFTHVTDFDGYLDLNLNALGLQTGSKVRILNSSDFLVTINYYDNKNRLIETKSTNQFGGQNLIALEYDFTGKVLKTYENQHLPATSTTSDLLNSVYTRNEYDHAGRLINEYHKVGLSGQEVLLANYEYNERGGLRTKNLHSTNGGSNFLQSVDYKYNIRGWLSQINDPDNAGNDLFSEKLFYNNPNTNGESVPGLFNGNISGMEWKTTGDKMAYNFTYDEFNRITNAYYGDQNDWNNGLFDVQGISYDENGNIKSISRNAGITNGEIDNLQYTYTGNRLKAVADIAIGSKSLGFNDGTAGNSGTEYLYDGNGNMIRDLNKSLDIEYNELNLPSRVTDFTYLNYLTNSFDATGIKLSSLMSTTNIHTQTTSVIGNYYMGNFIYDYSKTPGDVAAPKALPADIFTEKFTLKYVLTPEGRITFGTNGEINYEYFLRDHLGNVRASFGDYNNDGVADLLQQDHYYPFGMQMPGLSGIYNGAPNNNYLYNGKELQTEMGLNWHDYGSRMYDAPLARWHAIDPQAEKYNRFSPYNYCVNNPVYFTDPNGEGLFGGLAIRLAVSFVDQTLDNMINKDMSFKESLHNTIYGTSYNANLDNNNNELGREHYIQNDTYDGYYNDRVSKSYAQSSGDLNTAMGVNTAVNGAIVTGFGSRVLLEAIYLNEAISNFSLNAARQSAAIRLSGRVVKNVTKWGTRLGKGTSLIGFGLASANFAVSDKSWGDYGQLGIGYLSSGLTYTPELSTTIVGLGMGINDAAGGFDYLYNDLDRIQQIDGNQKYLMLLMYLDNEF